MAAQGSSSSSSRLVPPDDVHYIAKYKEMKRKVHEIELENDRLLLKCLKARKNIGRLRLERAILYERLTTTMPPPVAAGEPGFHLRPHPLDAQEYYQAQPTYQAPPLPYPPAVKPRPRKPAHDAATLPLPPPPSAFQETWKAGPRTYPFVHEYQQQTPEPAAESSRAPPAYPSEIRFHQYDTSERPAHRSRRDFDRDADKSTASYKARPGHDRLGHTDSHSHSPGPLSSSSSQGGPAYAPLRAAPERDVRPQRGPETDREPHRDPWNGPPDDWRRHAPDSNGMGPRKYHEQHDHRHPPEEPARHLPPIQKRSFAQFDQLMDGDHSREDRKRPYKGRDVEDDPHLTLPRVRAGDIVD